MKIILPGHTYQLLSLDGHAQQFLTFVRRRNRPGHVLRQRCGTNCQDVLRAVHDRVGFLNAEEPHWVNGPIRGLLRLAIWLFELRAARRRGHGYWHSPWFATHARMCPDCGHTACRKGHGHSLAD